VFSNEDEDMVRRRARKCLVEMTLWTLRLFPRKHAQSRRLEPFLGATMFHLYHEILFKLAYAWAGGGRVADAADGEPGRDDA